MRRMIDYIWNRIRVTLKIRKLDIQNAGIDDDSDAFVHLGNGLVFFGPQSSSKIYKYHSLLSKRIKRKLPKECFGVASNIIIRYMEGGLKLGGPRKERFYKIKQNDTVAEMGAYRGYYTIYIAREVRPSGKVIAIEPFEDNVRLLKKNIQANKLNNVIIVDRGVWHKKDVLTFYRDYEDCQSGSIILKNIEKEKIKIQVDTLDTILKENKISEIDFMIIQLNGAEINALQGLTLKAVKHFSIAARYTNNYDNSPEAIKKLLNKRGYTPITVNKNYIFT